MTLTLAEWFLVLAAYAYEVEDDPICSDYIFDNNAKHLPLPSNIPNFSPDTGQWIHGIEHPDLARYVAAYRQMGVGTSPIHIIQYPDVIL